MKKDPKMPPKRGIRWAIFRIFGPIEVQNLVNHIDTAMIQAETEDIVIYPSGKYHFNVKTSLNDKIEPMIFPTMQERASFQAGLTYGINLMGGTATSLDKNQIETLKEMSDKANSDGGSGSLN